MHRQLVFDDSGRIVHKCEFSILARVRGVGNSISAVSMQGCLRIRTSFERRLYKVHQGLVFGICAMMSMEHVLLCARTGFTRLSFPFDFLLAHVYTYVQ